MIAAYKSNANIFTVTAILIFIPLFSGMGYVVDHAPKGMASYILGLSALTGAICWFVGLSYYARAKGYSFVYGFLGMLGILGLLILLVMPDKYRDG